MPPSTGPEPLSAAEVAALTEICSKLQDKCAAGQIDDIPDEAITALLTTATLLYATATHEHGRKVAPFQDQAAIAATWVVVTAKSMLEAVNLSSFDLAIWSNRLPFTPGPSDRD
jgi:hypothetical protein